MKQWQRILIFILFLALAGGIYLWLEILNVGAITIKTNVENYQVESSNETINCISECSIKEKTGIKRIKIYKENYYPITKVVNVERNKTLTLDLEMIKIPRLEELSEAPDWNENEQSLPESLKRETIIGATQAPKSKKIFYLDQEDNRLKIWDNDLIKNIGSLVGIKSPIQFLWSSDETSIAGIHEGELYIINIERGERKKIPLEKKVEGVSWIPQSNKELLWHDQEKNLYRLKIIEGKSQAQNLKIDLQKSIWVKGPLLIYIETDMGRTRIKSFDPQSLNHEVLIEKNNFFVEQIKWSPDENTAYLYNTEEAKWYQLEL